jgi:hypothetical protein
MASEGKVWQVKVRHARKVKERKYMESEGKTRQVKERHEKTSEGKGRQGK